MPPTSARSPWIDAAKGVACLAIVGHHLSAYGPMSDTVRPYAATLLGWFYDYARMAVQAFLVVGGYLAAASLAPEGRARFADAGSQVARRFVRLAVPYAAALLTAVAAAALVRPWLDDPSVPGSPHFAQLLANALMLQDLLGQPALSAGVWYVAIDFQLYTLAVLLLALARRLSGGQEAQQTAWLGKALVVALCGASLLVFNRFAALDAWGIYFFGSYGLGMATFWAARSPDRGRWLLALAVLGAAALTLEFRPRIALALATCGALAWLALRPQAGDSAQGKTMAAPLAWVGQRSYSVFLVHFPVCLAVNAVFAHFWPANAPAHAAGLALALVASVAAGWLLYERVERHGATVWQALRWEARLVGGSLLVTLASNSL